MSFASKILIDSPNWWFRLDETDSQATSPGYKDATRTNYLKKGGSTQQVTTLLPTQVSGSESSSGGRATKLGDTGEAGSGSGGIGFGGSGIPSYGYLYSDSLGTIDWNYQSGDSLTLEVWVKPATTTVSSGTILQLTSAVCLIQDGADLVSVLLFDSDTPTNYVSQRSTNVFTDTTTVHQIAVVWSDAAKTRKHYVDGALVGTWTETGRSLFAKSVTISGTLQMGQKVGGSNPWIGVLDEPAMWRVALSSTRIAAHYASGTVVAPSDQSFTIAQPAPAVPVLSLSVSGSWRRTRRAMARSALPAR